MIPPGTGTAATRAADDPAVRSSGAAIDAARAAVASAISAVTSPAPDEPLLLAVSGGGDSTALALAASRLACRAHVVHVDHGLHPESADAARSVTDLATRLGLRATVVVAPPTDADPSRSETAARRRRLAALHRAALRLGARWVLLAHHLDDDIETIALHLLRGHRSDRATAGMPAWRPFDLTAEPSARVQILRPFLLAAAPLDRHALAGVCADAGVTPREDPTNANLAIRRNAVRARLAGDAGLRADLLALRTRARRRLAARLVHAAGLLERHLHTEGLGCRLDGAALNPRPSDAVHDHAGEVLRLLGATLARPRRVDTRRSVVACLDDLVRRGRGALTLPASPRPLRVLGSRAGLSLPEEALAPGVPAARALRALLAAPPPGVG